MPNVGTGEIILLLLLALLLFGAKRLPEIGRSLGSGMREFKDSVSGITDIQDAVHGINEVRSAATPSNLAGAFVPGVKDMQETVAATKSLANPLSVDESTASAAEPSQSS